MQLLTSCLDLCVALLPSVYTVVKVQQRLVLALLPLKQ